MLGIVIEIALRSCVHEKINHPQALLAKRRFSAADERNGTKWVTELYKRLKFEGKTRAAAMGHFSVVQKMVI